MKMPSKIEVQTDANTPSVLSDDELAKLNDSFPDGKFDWCRWSAESVEGVSAIRALLDSFHLVGKRIANVWTESYDFFNTKEEIEDEVFSDLVDRLGFTEEAARAGRAPYRCGHAGRVTLPMWPSGVQADTGSSARGWLRRGG